MVDEKTMTARHELLGETYVMREMTLGQHQKWNALKDGITARAGEAENETQLFMEPSTAGKLLSVILLKEDGSEIEFTLEMAARLTYTQLGQVLQDFFTLNPGLAALLNILVTATLRSSAASEASATGKDPNSGSISPAGPAAENSDYVPPS